MQKVVAHSSMKSSHSSTEQHAALTASNIAKPSKTGFDKRAFGYSLAIALVLISTLFAAYAAKTIVSSSYSEYEQPFTSWLPQNPLAAAPILMACGAFIALAAYLLLTRFSQIQHVLERVKAPSFLTLELTRKNIIVSALFIFALWLPILILMYPTATTVDTFNQLYQFQTGSPTFYPTTIELVDAEYIDHHPVMDTLLYGAFWKAGYDLGLGSAGLFALVIVQSIILAAELSFCCCYLSRLNVPFVLRALALLFFALFPVFGHYAATVLKDVTYLTFFIPWTIIWLESCRTNGATLGNPKTLVVFMVLGGFCVITKKLGLFLLLPCLVVLVAAISSYRLRIAASSVAMLVVFCALIPAIVYPAIGGVAPGGKQESLGPAIQHVTALLREQPDAFSESELEDLNRVFNTKQAVRDFEEFRSDGAKSAYQSSATNEDIARFLQIWASQGLKHPVTYLAATFKTCGMLYIPFMKFTYYTDEDLSVRAAIFRTYGDLTVDMSHPQPFVDAYNYFINESVEHRISDLPVVSLFFTMGFYGSWIPFIALALCLYARKPLAKRTFESNHRLRPLLGLVPTVFSVALMLITPVASPRYVLPLLFTAPLLLGWAWLALYSSQCPTGQEGIR